MISFWLFIGVCMVLYVYNKAITPDIDYRAAYHQLIGFFIIGAAIIGLFINLIGSIIKNKTASRVFNIICYTCEVVSVGILVWLIFR
jgi:uncharacterized membrane protein YsdA (DUF1294 family)